MKTRFAPGPYKLEGRQIRARLVKDSILIAEVFTSPADGGDPVANGKLLAAAPDLFKACEIIAAFYTMPTKEFVEEFGYGVSTKYVGDMARAAIAKALGQEPS